ncbi:MAG TPA: hypothetical protein VF861_03935 [Telluria sp.]
MSELFRIACLAMTGAAGGSVCAGGQHQSAAAAQARPAPVSGFDPELSCARNARNNPRGWAPQVPYRCVILSRN